MSRGDATGLVVAVPELDPIIRPLRQRADPAGLPTPVAHVTLLFPWVPPPVGDDAMTRLRAWARRVEPFPFTLESVEWFGEDVVWMRPEPSDTFKALTSALHDLWPEHPPYGGEHPDPTPHLTIGEGGDLADMRTAAEIAAARLPIRTRAESVWIMEGTWEPFRWWHADTVPLGPGSPSTSE